MRGHGAKIDAKQEVLVAALLTEPTQAKAAEKAGVSETTLYRWLALPEFKTAYRLARRQLIDGPRPQRRARHVWVPSEWVPR